MPIKGIFTFLIILSHSAGYISTDGKYDTIYNIFQGHLNQGLVVMFLFYSGFGIMEQIKKKGFDYVLTIPKKRFPIVLLHFDIAVLLFLILSVILGEKYSITHIILLFIGWESIGNSNWYIFVILALYIFTFISFSE